MISQAHDSNLELNQHVTTIIEHIKILSSPVEQLEKTLPIITEIDGSTILSTISLFMID